MKLFRVLVISLLAVTLLLGLALPAAAGGGAGQPAGLTSLKAKGEIEKANHGKPAGKKTIIKGVVTAKSGDNITIEGRVATVTADTRYHVPGVKNASLADIPAGTYVIAQTMAQDGQNLARQIIAVPGRSVKHYRGEVTAFTAPSSANATPAVNGSLTIKDKDNKTIEFTILPGEFQVKPEGETLKVGDPVTVIARHIPQEKPVAVGVIIHRPALQVSGNVTAVNEAGKTITIGTTVLKYNAETVFELHGAPSLEVGQAATAWYQTQADLSLLLRRLVVK